MLYIDICFEKLIWWLTWRRLLSESRTTEWYFPLLKAPGSIKNKIGLVEKMLALHGPWELLHGFPLICLLVMFQSIYQYMGYGCHDIPRTTASGMDSPAFSRWKGRKAACYIKGTLEQHSSVFRSIEEPRLHLYDASFTKLTSIYLTEKHTYYKLHHLLFAKFPSLSKSSAFS